MRRMVLIVSSAAVVAGVVGSVALLRKSVGDVPGNLPGGTGSRLNSWLNGPLYRLMATALDLGPDDELLDVACGEATFLAEYASRVRRVAGLDLSAVKVGLAQRRLADRIAAGTAEVVKGDARALPWEDGRFTAVTSMDAFPFFPDPERVLAEMYRVLRPGGRAIIDVAPTVPDETESHEAWGMGSRYRVWNAADVRRMTEAAGFGEVVISSARVAGDNRLGNLLARLYVGTDEDTIIAAVKPA